MTMEHPLAAAHDLRRYVDGSRAAAFRKDGRGDARAHRIGASRDLCGGEAASDRCRALVSNLPQDNTVGTQGGRFLLETINYLIRPRLGRDGKRLATRARDESDLFVLCRRLQIDFYLLGGDWASRMADDYM